MTLFEIAKPASSLEEEEASQGTGSEPATNQRTGLREVDQSENGRMVDLNAGRFVRYQFTPQVRKAFGCCPSSKCKYIMIIIKS